MTYFDLSIPLTEATLSYPGDPHFIKTQNKSLDAGESFDLCNISMGNHTGTHIDFPRHVLKNGKTSNDYSLDHFIGTTYVVHIPNSYMSISKELVEKAYLDYKIPENAIIFFRTSNTDRLSHEGQCVEEYVFIEPHAAEILIKNKARIVGIDYISVDSYDSDLPVHKILLDQDILIVENLSLKGLDGKYEVFIVPLNIPKMDGLPVRVFAKSL